MIRAARRGVKINTTLTAHYTRARWVCTAHRLDYNPCMEGETHRPDVRATSVESTVVAPAPHTLRLQSPLTPFIGRERQVAQVCALLARPSVRLVTLSGPGGIGKTRLALAVADAVRPDFPDGVFLVSLAGLMDASLLVPALAQALGLPDMGRSAGEAHLLSRLQALINRRKMLLVLDNFEQVIDAAVEIAALLAACTQIKVLVTSREVLRIAAEHNFPVPPLAVPDIRHLPPIEFLGQIEAVRLLVTRAQAASPGFALTQGNSTAVASICHRLEGLPLAIELAAARSRLLTPADMLSRLEHKLPWLTGGAKDSPARHQTLRAAIGWSYDLLEPDEQQLFRRLAIFVGRCTVEALAAVCGSATDTEAGEPDDDLLHALTSLLDKSLLRQAHDNQQGRLYMLETIREFAMEQLQASGEAPEMHRAHAHYYLALAENAEPRMVGPEQTAWLNTLEQEHENLRAALACAAENRDTEVGARLAAALWRFWLTHGHITEGRRWLHTFLSSGALSPELRARVLNAAGPLAVRQGDFATAHTLLEESLALWRTLDDPRGEMEGLDNLGLVAIYQDDLPLASTYFQQSLEGWRRLGDKHGMTTSLNRLGLVMRYQGNFEQATRLYDECYAMATETHDTYYVAASLHNMGQMAHHRGDDERAYPLLMKSVVLVRQLEDTPNISTFLADLAGLWASQGHPERAARLFGAAEALRENMQVMMYEAQRKAYVQDIERGRAQLDPAIWDAAWANGRTMSLDEAFALALQEIPTAVSHAQVPGPAPARPQDIHALSDREVEVLRLLVAGLTYDEIASRLTLSFHTVHAHLRSIYSKLGVTSRSQATRFATEHGLA
jgi:predicted ATPase/DNA-binding CsgD family transcriptional regulator